MVLQACIHHEGTATLQGYLATNKLHSMALLQLQEGNATLQNHLATNKLHSMALLQLQEGTPTLQGYLATNKLHSMALSAAAMVRHDAQCLWQVYVTFYAETTAVSRDDRWDCTKRCT